MALADKESRKKRQVVRTKANSDSDSEAPLKKRVKTKKQLGGETVNISRDGSPAVLDEQSLFLIQCYNDLGHNRATKSDWTGISKLYSQRFPRKQDLAWNTIQKKCNAARKVQETQAELGDDVEEEEEEEMNLDEDVGGDVDDDGVVSLPLQPEAASKVSSRPVSKPSRKTPLVKKQVSKMTAQASAGTRSVPNPHMKSWIDQHPGASIPSSISTTHIPSLSRMNFHLRTRSDELAVFTFAPTINEEDISVDHDILHSTSPLYANFSRHNPDAPIPVPEHVSPETVNAFVQLISPERATSLPTHYLWSSKVPEPGVYDRFGGIEVEKIHWSVETLLQLYVFARWMEVVWVGDMVIDRLHWMYLTQKKVKDACGKIDSIDGSINLGDGEKRIFGSRLPYLADLEVFGLAVEDFETVWLSRLGTTPVDVKMLTFIADVVRAFGGGADDTWLSKASMAVQNIFALSSSSSHSPLVDGERENFCSAYHHHDEGEPCYTSVTATQQKPDNYFIHQLFATSSRDELLTLSEGVAPPTELASIMYAASGTPQKLRSANSSPEMLDAEKMVLEMEMRLERAKMALAKARAAGREDKTKSIGEAKGVAKGMFNATTVLRT